MSRIVLWNLKYILCSLKLYVVLFCFVLTVEDLREKHRGTWSWVFSSTSSTSLFYYSSTNSDINVTLFSWDMFSHPLRWGWELEQVEVWEFIDWAINSLPEKAEAAHAIKTKQQIHSSLPIGRQVFSHFQESRTHHT